MENIKNFVENSIKPTSKICDICGKPYRLHVLKCSRGVYIPDCDCVEKAEKEKAEKIKQLRQYRQLKTRYKNAGFPAILSGQRLVKLNCEHKQEAYEYVVKFGPKRAMGFHFVGTVGNGKTTLAVCIGKELVKRGFTVRFMTFSQCMRILQSTYGNKNPLSFDEQLNKFSDIDLLILDDFGRDGYKEQKLADAFEFLNHLYNNRCNVILTSNPEMIEKVKSIPDFGAMLDRFHKMAKYRLFKNQSFRREAKQCN